MRLTEHFTLKEFVSPAIYRRWGRKSIIFIDSRLPDATEGVRKLVGKPAIINGGYGKHAFKHSGFRSFLVKHFSWYSQHRFGRAIDIKFKYIMTKDAYKIIMDNQKLVRELGFTTIEDIRDTPSWIHLDMRYNYNQPDDKLKVVRAGKRRKGYFKNIGWKI